MWAYSAHANPLVATQTYTAAAATQREFPANLPVWKAACLNCHDTHTVQGARRLAREGTDSTATPKAGGRPALEETCYQCHTAGARSRAQQHRAGAEHRRRVPAARAACRSPTLEQGGGREVHDIGGNFNDVGFVDCTTPTNQCGKDFIESAQARPRGNRHAECTDCHNPHRV